METSVERSWREYRALPDKEWRKDFFDPLSGGFVATHVLKAKDVMKRHGIAKEVEACAELAKNGKRVLRLPENILDKIDTVIINGIPYRELLKFKSGSDKPKGYPDVFFDGQTWDFKTSSYSNDDSLRQAIKDGRKADNLIFIITETRQAEKIQRATDREVGNCQHDGSWIDLPNIYCLLRNSLIMIWTK